MNRAKWAKQDGGILVAATLGMVGLIFMGLVLVQVGSWFQDRRHLQVRADAGALAGAQFFNECFVDPLAGLNPKADMEKAASQYAGFSKYLGTALAGQFTPARNTSFGTGSNAVLFQSKTYPGGSGGSDDTNTANECDSGNLALDVKLTRDTGGILSISSLAHVHAHARVQLKEVQSVVPTFPLAVPELVPNKVGVTFVNEDTNAELTGCSGAVVAGTTCTYSLTNPNAGTGTDPYNLGPWTIAGAGVNLPAFAGAAPLVTHVGMRVGVGDLVRSCANSAGNGNTWECFNSSITGQGLVMIDDINPSAAIAVPRLQGLWPTTCSGSPFDGDDALNPCWATATAKVVSTGIANFRLRARITQNGGVTKTSPDMTFNAGTGLWTAPTTWATVSVNPLTGASDYTVNLCWKSGNGGGAFTCPAAWTHRVVGATDGDDGPLDAITLTDPSATVAPYSYNTSGIHTLGISVLLKKPFNKLTVLRQAHDGSATAFILCRWKNGVPPQLDNGLPGITDALEQGCQVPYQVNATASCSPDPLPAPENTLIPDCTQNKPSSSMGNQITKSLDIRFGCKNTPITHPNLWPNYSTPGDTRAVTLITTSYDAYAHNGSQPYPVTGFGAFYIAGVSNDACNDPWPAVLGPEPGKNTGTIWGYFFKYTNLDGTPSGRACQLNSLNNCVAVLTR
jgi:hypothetical protein